MDTGLNQSVGSENDPTSEMDWEVLVVGRSYAGLSAALTLGRARRATLVVGEGGPRNEAVTHAHGLLTRDGASPAELVALAEQELEQYESVQLQTDRIQGLTAVPGGFRARVGPRTVTASAVILATGVNDDPLPVPGLADHWGKGVFTCPFCDGWEHRDQRLGVLAPPEFGGHLSQMLLLWSDQIVLFTDGAEDGAEDGAATVPGVTVEQGRVTRVLGDGERVYGVEVDGHRIVDVDAIFGGGMPRPNNLLAKELGCDLDPDGFVIVDEQQATSVPGVWVAGDLGHRRQFQMAMAIASGVTAAVGCVRYHLMGAS